MLGVIVRERLFLDVVGSDLQWDDVNSVFVSDDPEED